MFRPVLSRTECEARLRQIFPRAAFDAAHANPLGGCAIAAMLYVDAVAPDEGSTENTTWARPSTVLWMMDEILAHDSPDERVAWREAAFRTRKKVAELLQTWGIQHQQWRSDTTREPLRDETWPAWLDRGAVRIRPGYPRASPKPVWALTASFADLFNPELTGKALTEAIDLWRNRHLNKNDLVRVQFLQERERLAHAVQVTLPGGQVRSLEPGDASLILKGVLERWAPVRLSDPVVLTVSEPGDKVFVGDAAVLVRLGLTIDVNELLPDAVIVDIGESPPIFWIVEAVASDGPVTEPRRKQLLRWAEDQNIAPGSCQFLSAFVSRHDAAARRRLKDLAVGTYAWYADEPNWELAWYEIGEAE